MLMDHSGRVGEGSPAPLCPLHQCTCCDLCVNAAAAFLTKNVTLDDITIKFEIWDTAGQGETRPDLFFLLRSSRRSSGYGGVVDLESWC